jgi:hypothetical protein
MGNGTAHAVTLKILQFACRENLASPMHLHRGEGAHYNGSEKKGIHKKRKYSKVLGRMIVL